MFLVPVVERVVDGHRDFCFFVPEAVAGTQVEQVIARDRGVRYDGAEALKRAEQLDEGIGRRIDMVQDRFRQYQERRLPPSQRSIQYLNFPPRA